jgi:hypothetical protein|tara:strand:- start:673 stop:900 length:228 start_codon:yes stop_codon:yes gene_type:complete
MSHNSVCRINKKSWTAGFPKQNHRANYHVGQKELELEITWKNFMNPQFIPFIDEQGHQGMRIIIEHQNCNATNKQ